MAATEVKAGSPVANITSAAPTSTAATTTTAAIIDEKTFDPAGNGMRVLVTGASGYIAGHIIKILLERGFRVRGTVRSLRKTEDLAHLHQLAATAAYPLELVEANLLEDSGWAAAVAGCEVVLHTASPFVIAEFADPNELIKPAVDGTLSVLRAAAASRGGVKRVVLTSSEVAISAGYGDDPVKGDKYTFDEKSWSNADKCAAYPKSKTLAERAAWQFLAENTVAGVPPFQLCALNPCYVQGPLLTKKGCESMKVISRFMNHDMPGVPRLGLSVVDVRDVALAHVRAVTAPNVSGNRYLLSSQWLWFQDYSRILATEFNTKGYDITRFNVPYAGLWLVSKWDQDARVILPEVDKSKRYDTTAAQRDLGMKFIPAEKSLVDMAYSLIKFNVVANYLPTRRETTWNAQGQPIWTPDKEAKLCVECMTSFGLTTRRHHCRLCGNAFCDNHCAGPERKCGQCKVRPPVRPTVTSLPPATAGRSSVAATA